MKPASDESEKLRHCWTEWTAMVRLFADRKVRRGEIRQESYQVIHSTLQEVLEDSSIAEAVDGELLNQMKNLSSPWINVDALANAEKPILKDLVTRCDALELAWSGRPAGTSSYFTGILLSLIFVSVFALVLGQDLWSDVYAMLFDGPGGKVPQWLRAVERNRNEVRSWTLGGSLAVAIAFVSWFVFRPPRSY